MKKSLNRIEKKRHHTINSNEKLERRKMLQLSDRFTKTTYPKITVEAPDTNIPAIYSQFTPKWVIWKEM